MSTRKWFDQEEGTVLAWALVATLFGTLFWLVGRPPCDLGGAELGSTILLGAGSGALAATVGQAIQRRVRERALAAYFGSYTGKWKRVLMYQYEFMRKDGKRHDQERLQETEGLVSEITYDGGQRLSLLVRYDVSRGTVAAAIDFPGIDAHVGSGTYFYTEGRLSKETSLAGLPHHGRFTMHLNPKEPDLIILLYDGLIPDPNARGYEVWKRVN